MENMTSYGTLHTIDTPTVARRARAMDIDSLKWNANDAHEASLAAEEMEKAGLHVSKSGGFYRDEATVYRVELAKRLEQVAKFKGDEIAVGQEVLARFVGQSAATRCTVLEIEVEGEVVDAVKKLRAQGREVVFTLSGNRWAYGYQVAARAAS